MSQEGTLLQVESLHDELFRLEPKIDLLHDLLGFGRYAEIHWDGATVISASMSFWEHHQRPLCPEPEP